MVCNRNDVLCDGYAIVDRSLAGNASHLREYDAELIERASKAMPLSQSEAQQRECQTMLFAKTLVAQC